MAARKLFGECLTEAVKERKNKMSLITQRLRDRLDVDSMNLMVKVSKWGKNFDPFGMSDINYTPEERQQAAKLLDLGIFRCFNPTERTYQYAWTDFGKDCYFHPNQR